MQALVHAATNAAPACPPASLFLRSMNSPGVSRLPVILHFYAPGAGAAALAFAGSATNAPPTSDSYGEFMYGAYKLLTLGQKFYREIGPDPIPSSATELRSDETYRPQNLVRWAQRHCADLPIETNVRLRHRLERQGLELVWWWVREVSKGGDGAPNTQIAASL